MADDIRTQACALEQIGAIQRFIHDHWRAGHILSRDRELLLWQHSPDRAARFGFPGPSILVALRRDDIVGMLGIIPADFNLRGRLIRAAWLALLNVIPNARSSLVGLRLLERLARLGFEATCVLGINDTVARMYRGLHYEVLDDLPRRVAVMDPRATMDLLSTFHDPAKVKACVERFTAGPRGNGHSTARVEEHVGPFDEFWDRHWRERLAPRLIGTDRSAAWLNWRYVHHPSFKYHCWIVRSESTEAPAALAVCRIETPAGRTERILRVLEFLSPPETSEQLSSVLLAGALRERVAFADFYCTSSAHGSSLDAIGFRGTRDVDDGSLFPTRCQPLEPVAGPIRGAFLIRANTAGFSPPLLQADDLYITKSDGDMDRPN